MGILGQLPDPSHEPFDGAVHQFGVVLEEACLRVVVRFDLEDGRAGREADEVELSRLDHLAGPPTRPGARAAVSTSATRSTWPWMSSTMRASSAKAIRPSEAASPCTVIRSRVVVVVLLPR